jgi:pimeloyl-ACP methyl ester carboxylesterase
MQLTCIDTGEGSRAVLCLHGVGGGAETFAALVNRIAPGRRALAWDMPGHGGSQMIAPYTMAGLAEAALCLMDTRGVERADLVGHSLGGMLALEIAATAPTRVASLALVGATPAFGSKDGSFEAAFLESYVGPVEAGRPMPEIARERVAAMLGEAPDEAGVALAIRAYAGVPREAYVASVRALIGFDRRAALAAIAVPALCLVGEHDRNAPPRSVEKMASAIPGSRFVCLQGAGHLPHLERPEAFARVLEDFLFG